MSARSVARGILVAVVLSAFAVLRASAQGVGGIGGTITDSSGAVLPGATVALSNPGTIGGNQETVTDGRGAFQFLRLVPGTYAVKAELGGFRATLRDGIVVNADVTVRVDLKLDIGTLEEGLIVRGEAPLLDTTSALKQTVLTREVLNAMPNRVDVWSVARVVPSVILSKVDVGGSEAFLQSTPTVHGSSLENGYFMDGMDVSALDGNGTVAAMYLDPYMFQETNIQTGGGGSAERQKGGLIFNMITKSGTNQFHGGYSFNGANHGMGSANYSDALKAQLLAAVPPAALATNPNIVPGADILKIYDTGAWLGGPIVRDKLWFSFSAHDQVLDQYVLGSYDSTGKQVLDDNIMWNLGSKVSWQLTRSAQLSYFNNLQYKKIGHRNGGGTFADSAARNLNDKYPDVHQVKWTMPVRSRAVVDVSWSRFRADDMFGQEPEVRDGDISRFDSVTQTYTVALPTYRDNAMFRDVAMASVSYYTGRHDLKLGYQFQKGGEKSSAWSTSGMRAVYRNGVPDSVNTYNTPLAFQPWDRDQAIYVQDKWTPIRRLVLNLGLRFETNYGWQPATCQVQTIFVQARCFPEISGAPDFKALTPRFSAVYDLSGDGRMALKVSANRYDQPINITIVQRLNPVATVSDTRTWRDTNGDLTPQVSELGPSSGFAFGTTNRYSPDLEWPVSNEYSIELQRQFPGNMVASVGYTRRETRRNIGPTNVAVPTSTYIPITVTEANSGQQVTVYNQAPALRGRFDTLWANTPQFDTNYNGVDVTLNKRLSHRWLFTGGASFGKTVGDIYATQNTADLNNPNNMFRNGRFGNDVPISLRLSGVYELPYRVMVSATAQRNTGFPELTTVSVGTNTIVLTQGPQTLTVEPRGTTRLPAVNSLDVSVRKPWKFASTSIEPRIDFYNLTNAATILGRITQRGPTYGRVNNIQRGRLIKLGVSVDF
ncbi:MAG TPA: TonB-dependent receptor [Vicinamibacterales bacterium]|nr:TonB-dependent receptor [Vicinamibacterales bacterium]